MSRASTSPVIPSSRGTENPQMSASSTPTVRPRRARATARLTVTELFPTPPLPEATAITRAVSGMSVTGAGFWASCRARAMTALRCSASITPVSTETVRTPGRAPTWVSTSLRIWVRSGHPATVRATSTVTVAAVADAHPGDHAQLDDVRPELGVDDPPEGGQDRLLGRPGPRPSGHGCRVGERRTCSPG